MDIGDLAQTLTAKRLASTSISLSTLFEALSWGQLLLLLDDRLAVADVEICRAKLSAVSADRVAAEKTCAQLRTLYKNSLCSKCGAARGSDPREAVADPV
jgi:hypothetical protein